MAGATEQHRARGVFDGVLGGTTGLSISFTLALLSGATISAVKFGEVRQGQQATEAEIVLTRTTLQSEIRSGLSEQSARMDATVEQLRHQNELFDARLQLWMAQLAAENDGLKVPQFGPR